MSFNDFMSYVQREAGRNKDWRAGQTYFNLLHDVRPDLANQIRATRMDPFHDDSRIPGFLTWLEINWNV